MSLEVSYDRFTKTINVVLDNEEYDIKSHDIYLGGDATWDEAKEIMERMYWNLISSYKY